MRVLKTLLDFYIRSSLHVAVCFVALAIVYNENYDLIVPCGYYMFLFCAAVAGYNLIKYGFLWTKEYWGLHLTVKLITILSIIIALWVAIAMVFSIHAWILLTFVMIINLLYVFPIWKGKGLRYSPFFKLFSVAIVWSILIVAIPQFMYYDAYLTPSVIWEFRLGFAPSAYIEAHAFKLFILVIALCIPFEIRDLKYDEEELHTLPQVLGVKVSKFIGIGLCLLYIVLIFLIPNQFSDQILELSILVITAIAIWFSDRFKSDYYASFFVEAIPLFWLTIDILLNN